jgi:HlyD family secretion protein
VANKLAGRVQDILVDEGDFVTSGQVLAHMQIDVLNAERDEARAKSQQAIDDVASAEAQVAASESITSAAQAWCCNAAANKTLRSGDWCAPRS